MLQTLEEGGGLCNNVLFLWVSDFYPARWLVGFVCQTWGRLVPAELSLPFLKQVVLKMLFWQGQLDSALGSIILFNFPFLKNILTWLSWNHLPSGFGTHLFLVCWSPHPPQRVHCAKAAAGQARDGAWQPLKVRDHEFLLPSFCGGTRRQGLLEVSLKELGIKALSASHFNIFQKTLCVYLAVVGGSQGL